MTTKPNNGCQQCGKAVPIDQRISHRGKIVCGDCFMLLTNPIEILPEAIDAHYLDAPLTEEVDQTDLLMQVMQMMVEFDKRLASLDDRFTILERQFESICG